VPRRVPRLSLECSGRRLGLPPALVDATDATRAWLSVVRCFEALLAVALAAFATAVADAAVPEPIGVVGTTLGRFDRDSLRPVGASIEVLEPHTGPALSATGDRFALGVSSPGAPGLPGAGRVGLWIVDRRAMTMVHEVRTGIAAEAVVFPGVVGALLQDGQLVIVDPASGRIRSRRQIGYSHCGPQGVQVAGRGVIVNQLHRRSAEVAIVEANGRVHRLSIKIDTSADPCRRAAAVAGRGRVYIVGSDGVVVLDPATRRTAEHRSGGIGPGPEPSVAVVPGGLAIADAHGLRMLDTTTWRVRWRDQAARSVLASGDIVIASGGGIIRARDAHDGRLRWSASGTAVAIAAGRVYAHPDVLDLATGARRGTTPVVNFAIRLI
jgi:hypothetical protein